MRASKPLVLTVALYLGAVTAIASPAPKPAIPGQDWFAVEILVFRYTDPQAAQGETWPPTVPVPSLKNALYPPAGTDPQYLPLTKISTLMVQAQQRLATTSGYEPLEETGWMQPGEDANSTRPVSLGPIQATVSPGASVTTIAPAAQSAAQAAVQVQGTAMLAIADNKPYIQLDLRLCEPPPPGIVIQAPTMDTAPTPATADSTAASMALPAPVSATAAIPSVSRQCFALQESHQVTPGQMEYFDTAAFGVLALVRQVTPPATAAAVPRARNTPD